MGRNMAIDRKNIEVETTANPESTSLQLYLWSTVFGMENRPQAITGGAHVERHIASQKTLPCSLFFLSDQQLAYPLDGNNRLVD